MTNSSPSGRGAAPIVVVATGGSGTRAVIQYLEMLGFETGVEKNHAGDAMPFVPVLERHINRVLSVAKSPIYDLDDLPAGLRNEVVSDFTVAIKRHLPEGFGTDRWAVKNPRHLFMIPVWRYLYPGCKVVHIVRDGRDMVTSRNQNQPRKHFAAIFRREYTDTPEQRALFWAMSNSCVKHLGAKIPEGYAWFRIEDLAGDEEAVLRLQQFLLGEADKPNGVKSPFEAGKSFGRGKVLPLEGFGSEFREGMAEFGYE